MSLFMFIMDNSDFFADLTAVHEYSTKKHNLLLQTRYNFTSLQENVEYSCKTIYDRVINQFFLFC